MRVRYAQRKVVNPLKILSSAAMREVDRRTIEEFGVPGAVLMESAGMRIAEFIFSRFPKESRIVVLTGPGNNGGDGLVAARLLAQVGYQVSLWSTVKSGGYKGDAALNDKYLLKTNFPYRRLSQSADIEQFGHDLNSADLLVDALLGIGTDRDVEGLLAELIAAINSNSVPVLAVDIPSGINADSGNIMGCAIKADWTVTFAAPKTGLMVYPGAGMAGEVVIGAINIPTALFEDEPFEIVNAYYVNKELPLRPIDAHKGSVGRVLIVAGSPGMSGAAALAAESALKGGAGLVYLAAPASACAALEAKLTEVITIALPEISPGIIDLSASDIIIEKARSCDVLAVGPGLDTGEATSELLNKLVQLSPVPMVFDAGALVALRQTMSMLRSARHIPVVTPHPGEMARLVGKSTGQVQSSRLETVIKYANLWNCIVMLKGPNTIIATPDGRAAINPTGCTALSTAGSGDLLTGLVASFIAQGMTSEAGARSGAFVHGLAGDLITPGRGHMAREILARYKETFLYLAKCDQAIEGYPFLTRIRPVNN